MTKKLSNGVSNGIVDDREKFIKLIEEIQPSIYIQGNVAVIEFRDGKEILMSSSPPTGSKPSRANLIRMEG